MQGWKVTTHSSPTTEKTAQKSGAGTSCCLLLTPQRSLRAAPESCQLSASWSPAALLRGILPYSLDSYKENSAAQTLCKSLLLPEPPLNIHCHLVILHLFSFTLILFFFLPGSFESFESYLPWQPHMISGRNRVFIRETLSNTLGSLDAWT